MTEDVDWAAVERSSVREAVVGVLAVPVFLAALTALDGGYAGVHGRGGWVMAGCLTIGFLLLTVAQHSMPRARATATRARRVQHALRHHVDPGPDARAQADVGARRLARMAWVPWAWALPLLAWLLDGRWDRPEVAVPAALVLVGLSTAGILALHRQVRRAQRWVADPPGPARDVPAPNAVEQWTGGRRLLLGTAGLVVVMITAGVLLSVLGRAG